MAAPLQSSQFKKTKDPLKKEAPVFSGGSGSKTMMIDKPKGLPAKPTKHPHRDHAGVRSKRAIANKGQSKKKR